MAARHPLLTTDPAWLVFAGDWHGNANFANGCLMMLGARGVDVIVHVGDFGVWPGGEGRTYLDSVDKVAARVGVQLLVLDGNHEDHDQLDRLERVGGLGRLRDRIWHVPRGTRWTWHGLRYGALGGATSVDQRFRFKGESWWPQEAITTAQADAFAAAVPVDVAVTHDAPAGVEIPGISHGRGVAAWGVEAIEAAEAHRRLLARPPAPTRPTLVVHGHFHVRYTGRWSYGDGWAHVEGLHMDGAPRPKNLLAHRPADLADVVATVRADQPDPREAAW